MTGNAAIRGVFDQECAHVKFDHSLLIRAQRMQEGFVNKSRDYVEFFGGNLTGVKTIRFVESDRDVLFDSIIGVDETQLEHDLYNLKDEHGHRIINQDHVRGSDVFNISCVYAIHRFHNTPDLDEEQRMDAKVRVCAYMHYKFLTSLFFHYFKYPADPEVAAATYAQLNYKYSLKQYGSWGLTLVKMAENMVGPTSVHIKTIETMDSDVSVELMINDIQNRIKDMLKNIYAVFMEVHAKGTRIGVSDTFTEIEGEIELKDKTHAQTAYCRYIKGIVADRNSFIKDELVAVISKMMDTASPRMLNQTLSWTTDNYLGDRDGMIANAIDVVMEHAIDYLSMNRDIPRNDLGAILDKLRGAYMSSRSTDVRLLKARTSVEKIVHTATGSNNKNVVAAVRTAWMLYIVARAYTMRHYANR